MSHGNQSSSNKSRSDHVTISAPKQYRQPIQMSMNDIQNTSTHRIIIQPRAAEQKVSTVVLPPLRSVISNLNHLLS